MLGDGYGAPVMTHHDVIEIYLSHLTLPCKVAKLTLCVTISLTLNVDGTLAKVYTRHTLGGVELEATA